MKVAIADGIAHISDFEGDDVESVVNEGRRLCAEGIARNVVLEDGKPLPDLKEHIEKGVVGEADIVVIGGGIVGCAVARELTRYRAKVLVIEKCSDLTEGTTKANNGMIHSGYDPKFGSLKAKLNVLGNAMYDRWAEELGFKFNRTGSFVCGFNEADRKAIEKNYENGVKNGVPGLRILSGDEAREIEPFLSDEITCALWTPSAGFVDPMEVTIKLMENAALNGAELLLNCEAKGFISANKTITAVVTDKGVVNCRHVVNAAGLYADDIAWLAGDRFYSIHPRRGVLVIFDKQNPCKIKTFSGLAPSDYTKGGGPTMTPDGTMLWGPSAEEILDKEDVSVDPEGMDFVLDKGYKLLKGLDGPGVINYFSGNRAASFTEDFIICNSDKIKNFTHVAGTQSPAVASAPAIAETVAGLVLERLELKENDGFNPYLPREVPFRELPARERGVETVVCRCELVTENEIIAAIKGIVPATTLDAVKRRTRAGMGRCQGGFCGSKVLEILSRELGLDPTQIKLKSGNSQILVSSI